MTGKNNSKTGEDQTKTAQVSDEIAACLTVDDLEGAHSRVEGSINYMKKKLTFQGKLMSAWRRELQVKIPQGAGMPEIEKVLRTIAGNYHKASTHKHQAECAYLAADSRANILYDQKVQEIVSKPGAQLFKGSKKPITASVEKAKRVADADPEIVESRRQALVAQMGMKMWIDILATLRFTAELAQSIQMGHMSENKVLSYDKSTIIQGRE